MSTIPTLSTPLPGGATSLVDEDDKHRSTDEGEAATHTSSNRNNSRLHGIHLQSGIDGTDLADDEVLYVRKSDGSKEPLDGNKVRRVGVAFLFCSDCRLP